MNKKFLCWFAIALAVVIVWRFLPDIFWQYLFLLRIPLLMGLLLLGLPIIAKFWLPAILKNLFVLRGMWQIAFTILGATVAGMSVTFVADIILDNARFRFIEIDKPLEISLFWCCILGIAITIPTVLVLSELIFKELTKPKQIQPQPTAEKKRRKILFGTILLIIASIIVVRLFTYNLDLWPYFLTISLALPAILAVTDLSKEEEQNQRWSGLVIGILFSGAFLGVFKWIKQLLEQDDYKFSIIAAPISGLKHLLTAIIHFLAKNSTEGYIRDGNLTDAHLDAFAFFLVLFIVYTVIFFLYSPNPKFWKNKGEAAALFYVMLLISIATLFLGSLTFFFDYYRVSVFLFWLTIAGLMYYFLKVDHYFIVEKPKKESTEEQAESQSEKPTVENFESIIETRLQNGTLVVICASGGGIQAAGWTVQVLTGLQQKLGHSFTKAIGLISSVSGGSVGSMYYLNRFNEHGYISDRNGNEKDNTEFNHIFDNATANSLDAVGWGLTYPDLWRIIALPILVPISGKIRDRGIALETNWQTEIDKKSDGKSKTLVNWRDRVINGQIPIPVFNATFVEDGFRFLISPVTFGESTDKKYIDFNTLYPHMDMKVVTAARLSATFPYVSPLCQAARLSTTFPYGLSPISQKNGKKQQNYHVADGGYFDNSGFVTAVEWLDKLLTSNNNSTKKIERVVIVQINPFPNNGQTSQDNRTTTENKDLETSQQPKNQTETMKNNHSVSSESNHSHQEKPKKNNGLFMATLGPLLTIFKVRDPILNSRNLTEVELLQEKWKSLSKTSQQKNIEIKYFPIFFPSQKDAPEFYNEEGDYRPPLSWKLTQKEKDAIKRGWKASIDPQKDNETTKLINYWENLPSST